MIRHPLMRSLIIAVVLVLGVLWALVSAKAPMVKNFPNGHFLVTAQWLKAHIDDPNLVIIDVREKKYLGEAFIPGSVHLEWKQFQAHDTARGVGGLFVGVDRAQQILGQAGIARGDRIVLYDAEKRDGAATSSYVFWVLDLLGHPDMMVVERGFEAWAEAGYDTAPGPRAAEPVLYQAPLNELHLERLANGPFIQSRLGDPFYQILDVRSPEEYLGDAANKGLDGGPLKLGHIPTAYNVNYILNWSDPSTKMIKPYDELRQQYAGLDPNRSVVTYCHSGRRGSFSYFILRTMGFEHISLYDASWFEWGNQHFFYPVETQPNALSGALPGASAMTGFVKGAAPVKDTQNNVGKSTNGYISCGG